MNDEHDNAITDREMTERFAPHESDGTYCKFKIGDVLRYQAWGGFDMPTVTTEQRVDAIRVMKMYGIQYEFFQSDGVIRIVDEDDCEFVDKVDIVIRER